ncbi:unnamed protein product, partial [Rotaria sp. Silwood1]
KCNEVCHARDQLINNLANETQRKCEESFYELVDEQREVEQKTLTIAQAVQENFEALELLTKRSITKKIKSYRWSQVPIEKALEVVMILKNSESI